MKFGLAFASSMLSMARPLSRFAKELRQPVLSLCGVANTSSGLTTSNQPIPTQRTAKSPWSRIHQCLTL